MVENEDINTCEGAKNYASTSNVIVVSIENPFPTFDPQKDVIVGMFVTTKIGEDDWLKGMPFFIANVINMERQAAEDGTFIILCMNHKCNKDK